MTTRMGGGGLSRLAEMGPAWWLRLFFLSLLNGIGLWALPFLLRDEQWLLLAALVIGVLGIDYVFLSPRGMPLRWIVPGLIFMIAMLIYPIFYTFYVAMTNWSTGHTLSKGQAIERTLLETFLPEDPRRFAVTWYQDPDEGDLRVLLVGEDGTEYFGAPRLESEEPVEDGTEDLTELEVVDTDGDGIPEQVDEFVRLSLAQILQLPNIDNLALDTPVGQALLEANRAALKERRYVYDEQRDVLVDRQLGVECAANNEIGNFECADGRFAGTGWRVVIGFDNFTDVVTDNRIREPFVRVFTWNIVYALLSVATQFGLGMVFALAFQREDLRGKAIYRSLLILPWAIPGFVSIIVWRGLLQGTDFGPVNSALGPLLSLFGTDSISWLNDPFWAKVSILLVNLWLGFPYMFLIISGALQAIPTDLQEAARTDGATGPQVFRKITMPLLLISLAPLLIASFAFNFNNFINIFLLTRGGPAIVGYDVPVGETDILISFTYNLAQASGRGQNFGLASAITFFIFLIVVILSAASFRWTKRLEGVYGNE
jgi:ABC-type sugar transport system permease subunit